MKSCRNNDLDKRITSIVSVAGFTPMHSKTFDQGTEVIMAYSHLNVLLHRLGFIVSNEKRLAYDWLKKIDFAGFNQVIKIIVFIRH
jgi:hypothetical protein